MLATHPTLPYSNLLTAFLPSAGPASQVMGFPDRGTATVRDQEGRCVLENGLCRRLWVVGGVLGFGVVWFDLIGLVCFVSAGWIGWMG